jgi:hypothetical protein
MTGQKTTPEMPGYDLGPKPWAHVMDSENAALIKRARFYLSMNAAESGADVLISELADALEARLENKGQGRDMEKELADIVREFMARLALDSEEECRDVCQRLEIENEGSMWELAQRANAALDAVKG